MNNITLNWSQEDRLRIDTLIGLLEGLTVAAEAKGLIETKVVEETIELPEPDNTPDTVAETPAEAPQEVVEEQTPQETENAPDEPTAPTVTKQDILQKVIALCGVGKKAEAKDVITTYADSVSDLPDSALVEVWDKLTALEG